MAWTEDRVEVLKKLWAEGHSASQIAKQLGGVTRNAVIGKVHRLGLSGRATPSRPVKRPVRLARPKPRLSTPSVSKPAAGTQAPASDPIVDTPAAPVNGLSSIEKAATIAMPPQPLADGEAATILTIRDSMCKWPIGDPADPDFAFCGRKRTCGPYCAEHAKIAFQPSRKRDRKREERDVLRRIGR
ncbi:MAG: GcrA family cell cycle regulator [Pseudomonadota bacterium]